MRRREIVGADSIRSDIHQPSSADCRRMQREIRSELKWSIKRIANYVGVAGITWKKWEAGERAPSDAARRLIWFVWCSFCQPQLLDDPLAWLLWPGVQESEGLAKARRIAEAQARGEYAPCLDPQPKRKRRRRKRRASKLKDE